MMYKEWLIKAEHDLKIAEDELNTENPVTDMICYHCQQAVEKILKSFLIFKGREITKTHDIAELIIRCMEIDKEFEKLFKENVDELTVYSVEIRYPGDMYMPEIEEAEEAVKKAKFVREFVMGKIGGGRDV